MFFLFFSSLLNIWKTVKGCFLRTVIFFSVFLFTSIASFVYYEKAVKFRFITLTPGVDFNQVNFDLDFAFISHVSVCVSVYGCGCGCLLGVLNAWLWVGFLSVSLTYFYVDIIRPKL